MHKKSACEQRVGILTFSCLLSVLHGNIHTFQAFSVFSQPTGDLAELLQYVYYLTINFLEHIRAIQTCNLIKVQILQVLFTKLE